MKKIIDCVSLLKQLSSAKITTEGLLVERIASIIFESLNEDDTFPDTWPIKNSFVVNPTGTIECRVVHKLDYWDSGEYRIFVTVNVPVGSHIANNHGYDKIVRDYYCIEISDKPREVLWFLTDEEYKQLYSGEAIDCEFPIKFDVPENGLNFRSITETLDRMNTESTDPLLLQDIQRVREMLHAFTIEYATGLVEGINDRIALKPEVNFVIRYDSDTNLPNLAIDCYADHLTEDVDNITCELNTTQVAELFIDPSLIQLMLILDCFIWMSTTLDLTGFDLYEQRFI